MMKPEQIKCPHCGSSMRMNFDSLGNRFCIECWSCGARGPRSSDLNGAIKAFLTMLSRVEVA